MIIVIEGADGCGKTSVAAAVAERFHAEVIPFPNDNTATGKLIRSYLKGDWGGYWNGEESRLSDEANAIIFQSLNIANRMELMPHIIDSDNHDNNLVLARYWQSAWIYGQLDGISPAWLRKVHESMARADFNFLLDASAVTCMARRAERDGSQKPERYEGKLDFTTKVVDLYRQLWKTEREHCEDPFMEGHWEVIDAMQSIDEVVENITKVICDNY